MSKGNYESNIGNCFSSNFRDIVPSSSVKKDYYGTQYSMLLPSIHKHILS